MKYRLIKYDTECLAVLTDRNILIYGYNSMRSIHDICIRGYYFDKSYFEYNSDLATVLENITFLELPMIYYRDYPESYYFENGNINDIVDILNEYNIEFMCNVGNKSVFSKEELPEDILTIITLIG